MDSHRSGTPGVEQLHAVDLLWAAGAGIAGAAIAVAFTYLTLGLRHARGVLAVAIVAKLLATSLTVSSGWPGGFIIPLFFAGATLGQLAHHAFASAPVGVVRAALMVAANVGVTKTMLGSTLVVTEMGGLHLLPTTRLAAVIALLLTSEVGLIHSQRERSPRATT